MKFIRKRLFPSLLVISLAVFLSGCQKEPEMTREEFVSYLSGQVSADNLESSVRWLEGMGTRFALAENRRDVAVKIRNRFISMGYYGASLDSFYLEKTIQGVTYNTWQYNVIARVEGTDDDSISIVGAHYDNYASGVNPFVTAPGANDNASGMAAVMEIARIMRGSRIRPKHTVEFIAFAAEELGLHGSRYQAEKSAATGDKIIMMINHDMISYVSDPSANQWYLNIIHYDNSADLRDDAELLCDEYSSLVSYSDNTFNDRSDSYPYYLYGFKALFFHQSDIEGTYHTPGDRVSVCNFDYAREIVKVSCALLVDRNY
ncbi:MAG: M20/M25/M40 family metallo-hydrolase [Bacteroidota bacterium]|nr:M20/M25/M40 family metallo-hydrolase [Bacteroidota bacterium]